MTEVTGTRPKKNSSRQKNGTSIKLAMAALLDPYGSFSPKTASNTKSSYLQPPKLNNRDIKKHPKARAYEEDCVSLLAESRHENAPPQTKNDPSCTITLSQKENSASATKKTL
jgi:hypothetical protein